MAASGIPKRDQARIGKYIAARKSGKRKAESAREAGYAESSSGAKASALEKLPEVKNALAAAARKKGVNENRLAEVLAAGLKLPADEPNQVAYFKEAKHILGYGAKDEEVPAQQSVTNILIAINEARASGILPPGPVIPIEASKDAPPA